MARARTCSHVHVHAHVLVRTDPSCRSWQLSLENRCRQVIFSYPVLTPDKVMGAAKQVLWLLWLAAHNTP